MITSLLHMLQKNYKKVKKITKNVAKKNHTWYNVFISIIDEVLVYE